MSTSVYPVHVDATLDTSHLSRALWLVKWLLAIPHYVVLVFLWIAFFFLSVVAFFAILFTGHYPRAIFDFNVGVMRWSWRVAYYAYGALGTDRYPPFTINEVADYPAHLTVDYPEHLSRGLVLVKWWLLAIPQYLVVAFLAGSGLWVAWDTTQNDGTSWGWSSGLIGLLALIAAVTLLFTGRYPQQIFDLVLGLNRWCLRVAAYASLMTDEYPPFRLDMGGQDPGTGAVTATTGPPPAAAAAGGAAAGGVAPGGASNPGGAAGGTVTQSAAAPTGAPSSGGGGLHWGAGRVVTVVVAALLFLFAGGLIAGGTTLAVSDNTLRNDQGFLMSPTQTLSTGGYAIDSEPFTIDTGVSGDYVPQSLLGDVSVRADGGAQDVFIGVASTSDAARYLSGVEHTTLVDFNDVDGNLEPVYRDSSGSAPKALPGDTDIWVASASGTGRQELSWAPESGDWTVVVMNADGSANVSAGMSVGAEVPVLRGITIGMLVVGGILLLISIGMVVLALTVGRGRSDRGAPATGGGLPPTGGGTAPTGGGEPPAASGTSSEGASPEGQERP